MKRGRAGDSRGFEIGGQSAKFVLINATVGPAFDEVMRPVRLGFFTPPILESSCCPGVVFVFVAGGAGVRRAVLDAQIGARDPDAVIAAFIDDHVVLRRHVALDAGCAGRFRLEMEVVSRGVVFRGRVTANAEVVFDRVNLCGVRIVAVRAADVVLKHLALRERAVDVDLFLDLAVGVVVDFVEHAGEVRVEKILAVENLGLERLAVRVAGRAGVELISMLERPIPLRLAGFGIDSPCAGFGFAEFHDETEVIFARPVFRIARPGDVIRSGPVAGLAGDVHFRPSRVVGQRLGVKAPYRGSSSGSRRTCNSS